MTTDTAFPPICSCCDRPVLYVRGSMCHHDHRLCLACFYVWYDTGLTSPDEIKSFVLKAEIDRTFPFIGDTAKFERVKTVTDLEYLVTVTIREEIVRQYRDNERDKCPAGRSYYEEHISPWLIAKKVIDIVRQWDASEQ